MNRMQRSHAKSLYLSRPDHCPFCGRMGARSLHFYSTAGVVEALRFDGRRIVTSENHDWFQRELVIEHQCQECNGVWRDVMKLVDVEIVKDGLLSHQVARDKRSPTLVRRVTTRRNKRYSVRPSKARRMIVQQSSGQRLRE